MKSIIILMFFLLLIGIAILVLGYDHSQWIEDQYLKIFKDEIPSNFIKIFIIVGWCLTSVCAIVLGILLYFAFRPKKRKSQTIIIREEASPKASPKVEATPKASPKATPKVEATPKASPKASPKVEATPKVVD